MKTFLKIITVLFLLLSATLLIAGGTTVNGPATVNPTNPNYAQVNYYATPTGTGSCSSWDDSCTLRNAILRCPGTKYCEIYVGAGLHNMDNVGDATGTTVAANYVHIHGMQEDGELGQASQLINANAGATYILRVTGDQFTIDKIVFDNTAQADKNVTMLNIRGNYSTVANCLFRQNVGDGGGTGILLDNTKASATINRNRFRRIVDRGVDINDFSRVYANDNKFISCGIGMMASHANSDQGYFNGNFYMGNTTAWNIAAAPAKTWYSVGAHYANNTTNFQDVAAYTTNLWMADVRESGIHRSVYPLAAAGVAVAKNANAYVWGAYVEVIPAGTFAKPIKIENIVYETWSAAQTFKIELFYGSANPATISLGVYEITAGDPAANAHLHTATPIDVYIPAFATVGAKLMSSTAAIDSVTVALGYELL